MSAESAYHFVSEAASAANIGVAVDAVHTIPVNDPLGALSFSPIDELENELSLTFKK